MYQFLWTDDFLESLHELEKITQESVKAKIRWLASLENPLVLAKKLRGYKNLFRFRIANYRLVFRLSKQDIVLLLVKN